MASSKQSVLGDNLSLRFEAVLHAPNPTSLSILGHIEMTSHETDKVPAGNSEKRQLISLTFFKSAMVGVYEDLWLLRSMMQSNKGLCNFTVIHPFNSPIFNSLVIRR